MPVFLLERLHVGWFLALCYFLGARTFVLVSCPPLLLYILVSFRVEFRLTNVTQSTPPFTT